MTTMTIEDVNVLLRRQPLVKELTAEQFERLSRLAEVVDMFSTPAKRAGA